MTELRSVQMCSRTLQRLTLTIPPYSVWFYESATEMHRWFRKRKLKQKAEGNKPRKTRTSTELKNEQAINEMQDHVLNGEPIQKPIVSD